jgi:hypothetical protein
MWRRVPIAGRPVNGGSDQMSVVWASQTEAPQHHNCHGRHMPNWSVRRLVLALLVVVCMLTLASSGAAAGRVWRAAGAVAVSTLAATPASTPAPRRAQYSSVQPAFASGIADRWISITATV